MLNQEPVVCPRCKKATQSGKQFGHYQRYCHVTKKCDKARHFCCVSGIGAVDCQMRPSGIEIHA